MRLHRVQAKGTARDGSRINPEALRINFRRKFIRYIGARGKYKKYLRQSVSIIHNKLIID